MAILFDDNDQAITLSGLQDTITGDYVNDATVTVTLQIDGVDLGGETWPLAMGYVAGSNGNYRAILLAAIEATAGERITATVNVQTTVGGTATFTEYLPVKSRGFG